MNSSSDLFQLILPVSFFSFLSAHFLLPRICCSCSYIIADVIIPFLPQLIVNAAPTSNYSVFTSRFTSLSISCYIHSYSILHLQSWRRWFVIFLHLCRYLCICIITFAICSNVQLANCDCKYHTWVVFPLKGRIY